jgi:hypothetical protein
MGMPVNMPRTWRFGVFELDALCFALDTFSWPTDCSGRANDSSWPFGSSM